jgi:hypothetical protein
MPDGSKSDLNKQRGTAGPTKRTRRQLERAGLADPLQPAIVCIRKFHTQRLR